MRSLHKTAFLALLVAGVGAGAACTSTASKDVLPDPISLENLGSFTGVARLDMGSSCTGTLVDTGVDEAPAYLITNGHCTGDTARAAQQVTVDQEWSGQAIFLDTIDNQEKVIAEATRLEYSTMRGTDVGIVRLDQTLGELKAKGITPIPIASGSPKSGTKVHNVAAPVQEIDPNEWVLRATDCKLGKQTDLIELGWLWFNEWSVDCSGVRQGSSGSPLLVGNDRGTPGELVAMINTTNLGNRPDDGGYCYLGRPCELKDGKAKWVRDTSYAVPVVGIGNCFVGGKFSLGGTCPLSTSSIWANRGGGSFRGGDLTDSVGANPEVDLALNPSFGQTASAKTALADLKDPLVCSNPSTYANAEEWEVPAVAETWDTGTIVAVNLPEKEGVYAFCAVADEDYEGAATVIFEVDRKPPAFDPEVLVDDMGDGAVMVTPLMTPPEISFIRDTLIAGDAKCPPRDEFKDYYNMPIFINADQRPATYCAYGLDSAGNESGIVRVFLDKE